MASKRSLKLFDIQNKLSSIYLRFVDMVRYGVLRQHKQLLIVGDGQHPMLSPIVGLMGKRWKVTLVSPSNNSNGASVEGLQTISLTNFKEVEEKCKDKVFNSIMVLPSPPDLLRSLDFSNEQIVTQFPPLHHTLLMNNVLAYRLAHRYLAKRGVLVLSASQKSVLPYKLSQRNPQNFQLIHALYNQNRDNSLAVGLTSAQTTYMSVVAGDRDYTPLNSKVVVGLSNELWQDQLDQVVSKYQQWAKGKELPESGSFALFKAPFEKAGSPYVEYL